MRKINANFSLNRIKRIASAVYRDRSNQLPEINKLIIKGKNFTPARIERLELTVKKIVGSNETITIPRESLTFLSSNEPYEVIDGTSSIEGNYIVLPWNISTELGRENLRKLIEQLPSGAIAERNVSAVQFSIYENTDTISIDEGSVSNIELSMSRSLRLDNTEVFQDRIKQLEQQVFTLEHDLGESNINNSRKDVLILEKDELIGNLNVEISDKLRTIGDLEVRVKNLDATVTSLQATNTNLRSQITQLNNRVQTCNCNIVLTGNTLTVTGAGANWMVVNGCKIAWAGNVNVSLF